MSNPIGLRRRVGFAALLGAVALVAGVLLASPAQAANFGCEEDSSGHGIAHVVVGPNTIRESQELNTCDGQPILARQHAQAALERDFHWSIAKEAVGPERIASDAEDATFTFRVTATPLPATVTNYRLTGNLILENPNPWPVEVEVITESALGAGAECQLDTPPGYLTANGHVIVPAKAAADPTAGPSGAPLLVGAVTEGYLMVGVVCDVAETVAINGIAVKDIDWDLATSQLALDSTAGSVQLGANVGDNVLHLTYGLPMVTVVDDHANPGSSTVLGACTWNDSGTPCVFEYDLALPAPAGDDLEVTYPNSAWLDEAPEIRDDALVVVHRAGPGDAVEEPRLSATDADDECPMDEDGNSYTLDLESGECILDLTITGEDIDAAAPGASLTPALLGGAAAALIVGLGAVVVYQRRMRTE